MSSTSSLPSAEPKRRVSRAVVDTSAVLATLFSEAGGEWRDAVAPTTELLISSVNATEVLTKLIDKGVSAATAQTLLADMNLVEHGFAAGDSRTAAGLRDCTRAGGLSLGDRACLALALSLRAPAITADRLWAKLDTGVDLQLIR